MINEVSIQSLDAINEHISAACDFPNYDDLSTEDKVKYDLYLSYSINSLYWMYCKLQAVDTNTVSMWYFEPFECQLTISNIFPASD